MYDIITSDVAQLPPTKRAEFLSRFLFNITIGIISIYVQDKNNLKFQLYGVNHVYHMVIPHMNSLLLGFKDSYTIDTLAQKLREMGPYFDIVSPIGTTWEMAREAVSAAKLVVSDQ